MGSNCRCIKSHRSLDSKCFKDLSGLVQASWGGTEWISELREEARCPSCCPSAPWTLLWPAAEWSVSCAQRPRPERRASHDGTCSPRPKLGCAVSGHSSCMLHVCDVGENTQNNHVPTFLLENLLQLLKLCCEVCSWEGSTRQPATSSLI